MDDSEHQSDNSKNDGAASNAHNYQTVSGYLILELPNNSVFSAFYKVVTKKQWFVLDSDNCQLVGYEGPDKVNKAAITTIDLTDATITIDANADNTFTLNCAGKAHKIKALNYESMMVWVQAIQSLREMHKAKLNKAAAVSIPPAPMPTRAEAVRRLSRTAMPPSVVTRTESVRRITPVLSREAIAECDDDAESEEGKSKTDLRDLSCSSSRKSSEDMSASTRSISFALADIAMRGGAEHGKSPYGTSTSPESAAPPNSGPRRRISPASPPNKYFGISSLVSQSGEPECSDFQFHSEHQNASGGRSGRRAGAELKDIDLDTVNLEVVDFDSDDLKNQSSFDGENMELLTRVSSLQETVHQRDLQIKSMTIQLSKREKDLMEMDERIQVLEMQLKQSQDTSSRPAPAARSGRRFSLFGGNSPLAAPEPETRSQQSAATEDQLIESCKILTNKNQFLNSEIKRLEMLHEEQRSKVKTTDDKIVELTEDLAKARLEHLNMLQHVLMFMIIHPKACNSRDPDSPSDGIENLLRIVEAVVIEQLNLARSSNPGLPTIELLTTAGKHYVDRYGFKYSFAADENVSGTLDSRLLTLETLQGTMSKLDMLSFVCWQLQMNYDELLVSLRADEEKSSDEYWKRLFSEVSVTQNNARALFRNLVIQNAIPSRFRGELWRTMIRNVPPVSNKLKKFGTAFYQILAKQGQEDQQIYSNKYARQIAVDLLRTMPNNVHFANINADRIKKLSEVLLAFLRYNSTIGYYQGMNFIVANALLYLDKEDTFWLLVAITEHYFHREQFFPDLIGLQADQLVLKELIEIKLPRLFQHFKKLELDIEVVSFTWFATLFFGAFRFETLSQIWDCFLIDGRKFLFRLSLALLKQHQNMLLEQTDALSAWRSLKLANQTVVTVEKLINSAYQDFRPFPKRKILDQKQAAFIEQLRQSMNMKLSEKQQSIQVESEWRKMENEGALTSNRKHYYHGCAVVRTQSVWLSYGDNATSNLSLIDAEKRCILELDGDYDAEVTAMCTVDTKVNSLVLVSFANGRLCAFDHATKERLWYIRIRDAILCCLVIYCDQLNNKNHAIARIFCGTADGSLAIMEIFRLNYEPAVFYVNLCQSPITAMFHLANYDMLVCASQDKLHALAASTLDKRRLFELETPSVDEKLNNFAVRNKAAYQRKHIAIAHCMKDEFIFVVRKYSSVIECYAVTPSCRPTTNFASTTPAASFEGRRSEISFQPLFTYDISNDGMRSSSRHGSGEADLRALHYRITNLQSHNDLLWVGSSSGEILFYELSIGGVSVPTSHEYASAELLGDLSVTVNTPPATPLLTSCSTLSANNPTIVLRMKNKLSELPVIEFIKLKEKAEDDADTASANEHADRVKMFSLSGCYGDDESALLWQTAGEESAAIWTNEPLDFSKRKPLLPPSARVMHKLRQNASELTVSAMQQTLSRDNASQRSSTDDTVDESPRKRYSGRRKMSVF